MDERILEISGWMQQNELEWLYEASGSLPGGSLVIESGTWKGRSTAALWLANQRVTLVTVDTWLGQANVRFTAHAEATERDVFLDFMRNMAGIGVYPTWYEGRKPGLYYLRMDTVDAASLFDDETVDLLFVDDDHSLIARSADAWYPKVKLGGIASGHDYSTAFPSIMEYVDGKFGDIQQAGSIWITRKSPTNT